MSALQEKFDQTLSRADDLLRQRLQREAAELERQDADDRVKALVRAREHAEARRLIAERYDDSFAAFNVAVPQATDDEAPGAYRRRLFGRLMRKLPDKHDLQGIRADDLPSGQAFDNIEKMLLQAALSEGLRPSFDSLPRDGSMISRIRIDDQTGEKSVNFYGRESFIKDLSRGGHKVERIVDRRTNQVIWGKPFDQVR